MAGDPSDYMPPELEQLADRMDNVRVLRPSAGEGKGEPKKPLFAFELFGEFADEEDPPEFVLEDMIEVDTLTQIFGDPGACKSFVALSIALSCAAGVAWFGREVKQGPVCYIAGEGRRGLKRRARAWSRDMRKPLKGLPIGLSTTATQLTSEVAAAELLAVIAEFTAVHGKPVLIVLDTLARNFGPADENSTQDMNAAVVTLDAIRTATEGAALLVVHHTGHTDKTRARGSIVMFGALDHEYRLTRDLDGLITFHNTKMKDGEAPPDQHFRLENVELGFDDKHGKPVHSAVLRSIDAPPAPATEDTRLRGKHQRTALAAFHRLFNEHYDRLAAQGFAPEAARVLVDDWRLACLNDGIPPTRFYSTRDSLVALGFVRIGDGYVIKNEAPDEP